MKKILILLITTLLISCVENTPCNWTPPTEYIKVLVLNEENTRLEDIKVEVFYDKELTQIFDDDIYSFSNGKYLYTDFYGQYSWGKQVSLEECKEGKDIYILVTDTSKIYTSQIKKNRLEYNERCFAECQEIFNLSKNK